MTSRDLEMNLEPDISKSAADRDSVPKYHQ